MLQIFFAVLHALLLFHLVVTDGVWLPKVITVFWTTLQWLRPSLKLIGLKIKLKAILNLLDLRAGYKLNHPLCSKNLLLFNKKSSHFFPRKSDKKPISLGGQHGSTTPVAPFHRQAPPSPLPKPHAGVVRAFRPASWSECKHGDRMSLEGRESLEGRGFFFYLTQKSCDR